MKLVLPMLALFLALQAGTGLQAAIDLQQFADENQHQRYLHLIKELRCPKCQNQNIADSNSPISTDLRQQVYLQIRAGKTDQEIIAFMVERYGQFIVYRPPVIGKTLVLWVAPFVFVALGFLVVLQVIRRSNACSGGESREELE